MTFLVDAQLPPLLARALVQSSHAARHVEDLGLREATDRRIWQHALENNLVVVTKDFDFVDRAMKVDTAPAILWLRLGNCSNTLLVERILSEMPKIIRRLEMGDRLVEID